MRKIVVSALALASIFFITQLQAQDVIWSRRYGIESITERAFSVDNSSDGDIVYVSFDIYKETLCCVPPVETSYSVVTLEGVTLLIEVPDHVPVEKTTWGRIKGLFVHD